ncbi:E3 ubiquitin-protein ligase TRIM36-like [Saccostrea cucullata]|uniref:E3 ubiquitin-protein ligase TRIM36-like n=1 Tax=Saccostrea cuccullata TaxID=36930 RepID=UPI002ED494B3
MATSSDPLDRAQDIKRCQLCPGKDRKSAAETVCNTCHVDLCKNCVGHHMISNPTIRHDVVTFEFKKSEIIPPQCSVHDGKQCEMFCEQCESPICQKCLSSGSHENHNVPRISVFYSSKQELIRKDLNELETSIAPVYESVLTDMKEMLQSIEQKHEERQRTLDDIGKTWHNLVDKVIKRYKSDATKKEKKDVKEIKTLESDFLKCFLSIQSKIDENKFILASNDLSQLANYTTENEKFRTIPSRFKLKVQDFSPKKLTEQALCKVIGDIPKTVKTCIQGQVLQDPKSNSSSGKAVKKFLDLPLTVGDINTDEEICGIVCIPHTDHFWVKDFNGILKQMNKEGEVLRKIEDTNPYALTVTREGHLVYIEKLIRVINILEGDKTKCFFIENDWSPAAICSTYTDDLLVLMESPDTTNELLLHRKVVRYCDSMCHILIADIVNDVIHIIDQNGQFLQYIDICELNKPCDLSIDSDDIFGVINATMHQGFFIDDLSQYFVRVITFYGLGLKQLTCYARLLLSSATCPNKSSWKT